MNATDRTVTFNYVANCLISTTHVTDEHRGELEQLKAGGFDGLEVAFFDGTPEYWASIAKLCREIGLQTPSAVTVCNADADPSSEDETIRQAGIAQLGRWLECCQAMAEANPLPGGKTMKLCGPLTLPWGYRPEGIIGDELVQFVDKRLAIAAQSWRELAPKCAQMNVQATIEYLMAWEVCGPNYVQQVQSLVRAVASKWVGVLVDSAHQTVSGTGPEDFKRIVAEIVAEGYPLHVHVSAPHRGQIARCHIDWDNFIGAVSNVLPHVDVTLESFNAKEPFATGCRLTRPVFRNPIGLMCSDRAFVQRKFEGYHTELHVDPSVAG